MNESIEIAPQFIVKYGFIIILVFADFGALINIIVSYLTGDNSDILLKIFVVVCSIPASFFFKSTYASIDWTTKVDKYGIHWWESFGKTKDISWQEIGSIDYESLIVFDKNGHQFHNLYGLRNRPEAFRREFLEFVKDHVE